MEKKTFIYLLSSFFPVVILILTPAIKSNLWLCSRHFTFCDEVIKRFLFIRGHKNCNEWSGKQLMTNTFWNKSSGDSTGFSIACKYYEKTLIPLNMFIYICSMGFTCLVQTDFLLKSHKNERTNGNVCNSLQWFFNHFFQHSYQFYI